MVAKVNQYLVAKKLVAKVNIWWQNLEDNSSQTMYASSSDPSWIAVMPNRLPPQSQTVAMWEKEVFSGK